MSSVSVCADGGLHQSSSTFHYHHQFHSPIGVEGWDEDASTWKQRSFSLRKAGNYQIYHLDDRSIRRSSVLKTRAWTEGWGGCLRRRYRHWMLRYESKRVMKRVSSSRSGLLWREGGREGGGLRRLWVDGISWMDGWMKRGRRGSGYQCQFMEQRSQIYHIDEDVSC